MLERLSWVFALVVLAGCAVSNVAVRTEPHHPMTAHRVRQQAMPQPHVLTSINSADVPNISPERAAAYLDFAHTNSGPHSTTGYANAGIKVIPYTNINHYIPSEHSGTNLTLTMAEVARTCDGRYVQWVKPDHPTTYLTDLRLPSTLAAWERWYTSFVEARGQAWGIFEDTADNPFTYASPAPPCDAAHDAPVTPAEWGTAAKAIEGKMQAFTGKPVIFNGLAPGYGRRMPYSNDLLDGPVAGGEAEACAPNDATKWLNQLTIEIHAVRRHKYFLCHGNDASDGSTPQAIAYRMYHFASMMLDFDLTRTIYESYFGVGPSNLRVQPESEVVPTDPVRVFVSSTADLLRAGGAYARRYRTRYRTCYVAGSKLGECVVVVNPTNAAVPFPFPLAHYRHTLLLEGSGILDGGTVTALGPAPAASVAPFSGEIAFP